MTNVFMKRVVKVQESGTNMTISIPAPVRSVLKPKKGDIVEWIIYDDKTIGIKIVKD